MSKNSQPLVTIVTPSYNQGQYIEETIQSVLNQTYKNIQYIIVDGGSTDSTMDVVEKYRDKVDIIIHEKDEGQTDAINKGFRLAKGELVGWINSDDILYKNCVENIVSLYKQNTDGAVFYSSFNDRIDAQSELIETYRRIIPDKNHLLNKDYSIIQQASFYRNDILQKIDYLDKSIHYCMDLDLWLRLLNHGPIYSYNEKSLAGFRRWEETKTSTGRHKFMRETRKILRKNGANKFAKAIFTSYWREFKALVKSQLVDKLVPVAK